MHYIIKVMLKSKVSILCLIFLLGINLFSMWELERKAKNYDTYEAIVEMWKTTTQSEKGFLRTIENQASTLKGDQDLQKSFQEYLKMFRYQTELYEKSLEEMYKTKDVRECKKIMQQVELSSQLTTMNLFANENDNRPYFQDVFQEEIGKYKDQIKIEEWPYDTYLISDYGNGLGNVKERYLTAKSNLAYRFSILDQDSIELTYSQASPWSFLAKQISMDRLPMLLLCLLAILYTVSWVVMLKDTGCIRLEGTAPFPIGLVMLKHLVCIFISYIIIVVIAYAIPIILLGVRHGFEDFHTPMLLYQKGLTSFQSYTRTNDLWSTIGLSSYTSSIPIDPPLPYLISEETSFIGFSIVLGLSLILTVFQVFVYCLITLGITFWMKNKWCVFGTGVMFILLLWGSQNFDLLSAINPFSISQPMLIVEGSSNMTWFHAMIILTFSAIFIVIYQLIVSKRKGIE